MHEHGCKYGGIKMLVIGLLILAQAYWTIVPNWAYFIGAIIALKGIKTLIMPGCKCKGKK